MKTPTAFGIGFASHAGNARARGWAAAAIALATTMALAAPGAAASRASLRIASRAGGSHAALAALSARRAVAPGVVTIPQSGTVSTRRAVLASLLLPGLGDWLVGHRERAVMFMGADAALWTGVVVSRVQGGNREDAYRDWAVRFAGVTSRSHSDDFYALLRRYDSSDDYAIDVKLDGRRELWVDNDPNLGRDVLDRYFLEHRIADYEPWRWQSLRHKVQFQEIRTSSKNAYRRATYFAAGAAALRVASAIVTWATLRRGASDARTRVEVTPRGGDPGVAVSLVRRF